jgi:putative oxidoreductase
MRIAGMIARYLLGLVFLVFGVNGFLHFIPMQPMPGAAGQFMGAIYGTGYLTVIFLLEVVSALLLLSGFYVPLGLVLIAPVIVNILLFHLFLAPAGIPLALVMVILWVLTALSVKSAFAGILQQKA